MVELESSSPEETERIAAELAEGLRAGDVVTVAGELGTGKTTFVRGACRALGAEVTVTSPTYAIGHRYPAPTAVAHLDLYRFSELDERDWADLEPYFEGTVAFVEWPEAAARFLPEPRLAIRLRYVDGGRRLITVGDGTKSLQTGENGA